MTERFVCGRLDEVPIDRAIAVADGRAVLVRIGGEVRAFENRCLHADQPLANGVVSEGVLMCPHHFWRYDGSTGALNSSGPTADHPCLASFDVDVVDGLIHVTLPPPPPSVGSMRELLLEHARTWDRDTSQQPETPQESSDD